LITDYCWSPSFVNNSNLQNQAYNYLPFPAPELELNLILSNVYRENSDNITNLSQAQNFLYLINPSEYLDGEAFVNTLAETNYDLLIIDLFDATNAALSNGEINHLKKKGNCGQRMVIAYISIGEAEDYRYYWKSS
jgi:cysteinyl-tRNA synthetase